MSDATDNNVYNIDDGKQYDHKDKNSTSSTPSPIDKNNTAIDLYETPDGKTIAVPNHISEDDLKDIYTQITSPDITSSLNEEGCATIDDMFNDLSINSTDNDTETMLGKNMLNEQQTDNLESRVSAVESKVDHLDRSVETLNDKVDHLNKTVDKLDSKFDHLNSKVSDLDKGQAVLNSRFDSLNEKVETLVENNKNTKTTIIVTGVSSVIGILAITIPLVFSVQSISKESSEKSIEAIKSENKMILQQMEADRNQFERALEHNLSIDRAKEKRHEEILRSLREDLKETKALNQSGNKPQTPQKP
tara:strand:- start:31477 stop:32388 length:912 start_codon:yes stop_codon:yes gene_type:complete